MLPRSYLRFGADGLARISGDGDNVLLDTPVRFAQSDGDGGVLFVKWAPEGWETAWWLSVNSADPAPLGGGLGVPALLDSEPVSVGYYATDDCESNGVVHMVAKELGSGATTALQCGVGGPDSGQEPDSFGGGLYVGVEWDAVHSTGTSTAVRLVFRNERGEIVEQPANPYDDDCSPCELSAALSPDGSKLAVIHRPDAAPYRGSYEQWQLTTLDVPAELRVIDLRNGQQLTSHKLPAGAGPTTFNRNWFDGRYVVFGPNRFEFPPLSRGSAGDAVRTLQRVLVDRGADIEIDSFFGPATEAAVTGFHQQRFGVADPNVSSATWTALGVPDTIIDTHTGGTTEVPGSIALEIRFTGGADISPPPLPSRSHSSSCGPMALARSISAHRPTMPSRR